MYTIPSNNCYILRLYFLFVKMDPVEFILYEVGNTLERTVPATEPVVASNHSTYINLFNKLYKLPNPKPTTPSICVFLYQRGP
jgi:hypothetical protein